MGSGFYIFIKRLFRIALFSYEGLPFNTVVDTLKNESIESLEKRLKLKRIGDELLKFYNKYFLTDHFLPTDCTIDIDSHAMFWASDNFTGNFSVFENGYDKLYMTIFDCVKEFHDTILYDGKVNDDLNSFKPLTHKKYDDLTFEELSRDLLLFNALFTMTGSIPFGMGKHEEVPYGKFTPNPEFKRAYENHKNKGKELPLEEIIKKYHEISIDDATNLGLYVEDRYSFNPDRDYHVLSTVFNNTSVLIVPAIIGNKPLKYLSGGATASAVKKVYILGDVEEVRSDFLNTSDVEEIIKVGKINYFNSWACRGYNKVSDPDGVFYLKVNGNAHYYATEIDDSKLKHIKLHKDTKEICGGFISLSKLESIELPNIIKIHDGAFSGAEFLKEIHLPDSVEEVGKSAFSQSGISKLTLSNNLIVIEERAFMQCDNLKEVYIPESVKVIKREAFAYSENLKLAKVHIDTEIDDMAFDEQVKIERYGISKKKIEKPIKIIKEKPIVKELKTLTVEGNVFKEQYNEQGDFDAIHVKGKNILCEFSFQNLTKVKKVTVEGNFAMVDSCFFYDSELIQTKEDNNQYTYITINDNPHYAIIYGVAEQMVLHPDCKIVSASALQDEYIETIDFGNVEFIGAYACQYNHNLKRIRMSEKVKIIDKYAFICCGLEEVILPKSLRFLGANAFDGCENLKTVKIPKSCKVGKDAFPKNCNVIYY